MLVAVMEFTQNILKILLGGGIEPYGVDIVPSLRKIWDNDKTLNPQNFHIIEPNSSIKDLFDVKMDFIFANQSLYYLTNSSFKNTINDRFRFTGHIHFPIFPIAITTMLARYT